MKISAVHILPEVAPPLQGARQQGVRPFEPYRVGERARRARGISLEAPMPDREVKATGYAPEHRPAGLV